MATIGLIGHEYDGRTQLLKRRISDLGHISSVVNLIHLPRVTRASINGKRVLYDGRELMEYGSFMLIEMGIREPFFHVRYSREMWASLRERYLAFSEGEIETRAYAASLIAILAERKPMVNPPHLYTHRTQIAFHISALTNAGFTVPTSAVGTASESIAQGFDEPAALNLDERKNLEVMSFPKQPTAALTVWRKRIPSETYRFYIIGKAIFEFALIDDYGSDDIQVVKTEEVDVHIAESASKVAESLGMTFCEITLQHSAKDQQVWAIQADPSPDFRTLEDVHGLEVSVPLARYLVSLAETSTN